MPFWDGCPACWNIAKCMAIVWLLWVWLGYRIIYRPRLKRGEVVFLKPEPILGMHEPTFDHIETPPKYRTEIFDVFRIPAALMNHKSERTATEFKGIF